MLLTFVRGPWKGRELAFTSDVITVGTADQNAVPLPDETVSRRHLEIERDSRGYLLRDLGSTNGTFLDDAEIREAYLRPGSLVTLGETRFRFRAVQRRVPLEAPGERPFHGLVGEDPELIHAFALVAAVAPLDLTVLVTGEPGTGRRSLARALHARSPVRSAPCVEVDCRAGSAARQDSRLLAPGTGACRAAEGGTLILVEPGELPAELQVRLAEAIRRRRATTTGPDGAPAPGGQRFVAVTARDPTQDAERGRLAPDLRTALEGVVVAAPTLRARRADLPALIQHLAARTSLGEDPRARRVLAVLGELAAALPWPGNVAELEQALDALARQPGAWAPDPRSAADLDDSAFDPAASFGDNKARWMGEIERRYLAWLLERERGNVSRAARAADMDRKHLHRLLRRHGLR
jgi:DNA-binding NtrC family response regulator